MRSPLYFSLYKPGPVLAPSRLGYRSRDDLGAQRSLSEHDRVRDVIAHTWTWYLAQTP